MDLANGVFGKVEIEMYIIRCHLISFLFFVSFLLQNPATDTARADRHVPGVHPGHTR